MRTLFLCGAGNSEGVRLAQLVNRRASRWDRIALLDDDPAKLGMRRLGVEVVGPIAMLHDVDPTESEAANLVARATRGRHAVRERIVASGVPIASLVHPDVELEGVTLAPDVVVYRHVTLGPEASLADGACVFMGAVVGHESRVGACCVVAPNAVLNARVVLEEGAYVGSNASILPELTVGAWATVGAGSTVIGDVPRGASAVGVPAEVLAAGRAATGPAVRVAPAELEGLVLAVWRELLGREAVDPERNIFDQGGSSLLAIRAQSRLRERTGRDVAITDLFRHPTVRSLALHLGGSPDAAPGRPLSRRAEQRREARARP
jgi:sugar O-acyltransferase (sialic acid O-acetyltransferase NeuD family)